MQDYDETDKLLIRAFNSHAKPLKQPAQWRNISTEALAAERTKLSILNDALENVELTEEEVHSLVWLAGWEESTVRHIVSAFQKKIELAGS